MYDLEERTLNFSKRILRMVRAFPRNQANAILAGQCIRSASSIGVNYREANDALGKKDFLLRLRIARKEAKETTYWLELFAEENPDFSHRMSEILRESVELTRILSSIIQKLKNLKNNRCLYPWNLGFVSFLDISCVLRFVSWSFQSL